MKNTFAILFVWHFTLVFGQTHKLQGSWVLDYVTYKNGNPLEVNHPLFSTFMEYTFKGDKLIILDDMFEIKVSETQITTSLRTINYQVQEDRLFLSDKGDDKVFVFIKRDKFVAYYPEFEPIETTYQNQSVYYPNRVVKPDFDYPMNYNVYLLEKTPLLKNGGYFGEVHVRFILTQDNKIKEPTYNDELPKKLVEQLNTIVFGSEKFFKNTTGKDLLMSFYVARSKFKPSTKVENNFYKLQNKAYDYFQKNDFKNAISAYDAAIEFALKHENEKNDLSTYGLYLNQCKSYMADNQIEKACECFIALGGERNFDTRNYVIYYCK